MSIGEMDDIVYCSDLDEIWNPELLENPDNLVHSLAQRNYCYYLNMRSSEQWVGTLMSRVSNIFVGFNKLYRTTKPNVLPNGGWHFQNLGGKEQLIRKVEAYDHGPEIHQQWFKNQIQDRIDKQEDYLARKVDYQGQPFKFWMEEKHWPDYLKENKSKYIGLCK